jgi:ribosomal protein S19
MARSVWKGKFVEESLWFSMRKRLDEWKAGGTSVDGGEHRVLTAVKSLKNGVSATGLQGPSESLGKGEDIFALNLAEFSALGAEASGLYANTGSKGSNGSNGGKVSKDAVKEIPNAKEEVSTEKVIVVPKKGGFRLALRSGDSHLQVNALQCWSRSSSILAEWVGCGIYVYNGQNFHFLSLKASMVGHKLGEYAPTRKAGSHLKKKKEKKAVGKK